MSWYNNLGDLGGDIGSILQGKNPTNQAPPTNRPATGGVSSPSIPIAPTGGQTTMADDPSSTVDGDPTGGDVTGGSGGDSSSIFSGLMSALQAGGSALSSFLSQHGTQLLEAASVADAAYRQTQADSYAKQGLASAQASYDAKAPIRAQAIAGLQNPTANLPSLSNLQSIAGAGSGNPFAKSLPIAQLHGPGSPASSGSLPIASAGGVNPTTGEALAAGQPLTGLGTTPNPLAGLAPGQQTGPGLTAPAGLKPVPGWSPPVTPAPALPIAPTPGTPASTAGTPLTMTPGLKALPIAGAPTTTQAPNSTPLPYA